MIKRSIMVIALIIACTAAPAAEKKISMALSIGAFMPVDSTTRDQFGGTWTRVALRSFERQKPTEWRFISEIGNYTANGDSSVSLTPITIGAQRGFGDNPDVQPYVTLRGGPYFGRVEDPLGAVDNNTGLNVNAAFGVTFKQQFYVEIRYDYFSRFSGLNFDGISLSAGVRLFDL